MADRGKPAGVLIPAPQIELGLDFANTVAWRGSRPEESLKRLAEVVQWCVRSAGLPERHAREYSVLARRHPGRAAELFCEAIAIREAIYRIFYSAASGLPPRGGDLGVLNEALKRAPVRTEVERTNRGFGWRVEELEPAVSALLAPVLWSSADLLVGPALAKVRHCSNDRCLWLFLDESKNGTRRWCSMQSCGNRAKAHRHYLRQKAETKRAGRQRSSGAAIR